MLISDWSADVCSSDLECKADGLGVMVECFALRHRETVGGGAGELHADTDHCVRFVDMQGFELCQRQLNLLGGQIHGLPTDHAARTGGLDRKSVGEGKRG